MVGRIINLEDEKRQVSSLLYAMGEKADDIINSFRLSDDNQNLYAMVRGRFKAYLVKKRNIVFDRVMFFQMTYIPWLSIATLELYMMN